MWKDIRNTMRIYTRFHVIGGVLRILDEEHMQDTHGKIIITRHEYNCMERSDTRIDGRTHATRMDGYIYRNDRGSHRRLGVTIGWYDRVETHATCMYDVYLRSHMGHM
jgi:hypothetical protein